MSYELTGTLYDKMDTQEISEKFRKREFVMEVKDMVGSNEFVNLIKFQLTQDRCELIDNYNTGDQLKVSFNLRGRKWEKGDKVSYFTNLEAWRIDKVVEGGEEHPPPPTHEDPIMPEGMEPDDLPF